MSSLMIIDGNSLANRAFYALPLLSTAKGVYTNAAYGFAMMLHKVLDDYRPDFLAVAFDLPEPTFRHLEYEAYKAQRQKGPTEMAAQFPVIKEILTAYRIPVLELAGFEADDILGTVAQRATLAGVKSYLVTGDRDVFQLVSPTVSALYTQRKGITELETIDEAAVLQRFAVTPSQLIDLKGLSGDTSDNIPGVPGIGEKTAAKLIAQFGTVENILEHLNEVPGNKVRENLATYREQALLSKHLATIRTDAPLVVELDELKRNDPDWEALTDLYRELEFNTLLERIRPSGVQASTSELTLELDLQVISFEEMLQWLGQLPNGSPLHLAVRSDDDRLDPERLTIAACVDDGPIRYIQHVMHDQIPALRDRLTVFHLIGHDLKALGLALGLWPDHAPQSADDLMIIGYLLDPGQAVDTLSLSKRYLGIAGDPISASGNDIAMELWLQRSVTAPLLAALRDQELVDLYGSVELPLIAVLAAMERVGIRVDTEQLKVMADELDEQVERLTAEVYHAAGEEFNLNSTKQLGHILFDKLQLPVIKKTKTGYSTDVEVLEKLALQHEIVAKILEYRTVAKLKSTYADGLAPLINPATGRVHTTFNQAVTATGRLSSTAPNLQNIPIRVEAGRRLRRVFVPHQADWVIVGADYSQIELRVLAHIAQDEKFIEAFRQDQDIHRRTASEVFGIPFDQVTREQRDRAKAVNFGIVYGISDYGLGTNLRIGRAEAKQYIASFFERYPGVRAYQESYIAKAKQDGYVTTLLNRRRYLPDINSRNFNQRSFAERTAINTPIQGSAADIIKLAMVRMDGLLKERRLVGRMLLQVHDELICECPQDEQEAMKQALRDAMEQAIELSVPLKVDVNVGSDWYSLK